MLSARRGLSVIFQRRRIYIEEVFAAILVQPFTKEMGQLAAKIDVESRQAGASRDVLPVDWLRRTVDA